MNALRLNELHLFYIEAADIQLLYQTMQKICHTQYKSVTRQKAIPVLG